MKIAICDDNRACVDEIKQITEAFLCTKVTDFETDSYYDSQEIYNSNSIYDMAFLDIEMPGYSGIEVAKKLQSLNPHIIIFIITSYNQYLDDAMDLNVFRYIQKPLDPQRIKSGLERALKCIDNTVITFFLKQGNSSKNVASNDIIYIETVGRSTKIVTSDNEFLSDSKMDFWKSKLVASFFYRVHKSFIVNMNYITDYQRDTVVLDKKYKIPISYRKQAEFKKVFLSYIGGRQI